MPVFLEFQFGSEINYDMLKFIDSAVVHKVLASFIHSGHELIISRDLSLEYFRNETFADDSSNRNSTFSIVGIRTSVSQFM